MAKIHMVSAVDRNEIKGKVKTLFGRHLTNCKSLVANPSGESKVTCENCIKIIDHRRKEELKCRIYH